MFETEIKVELTKSKVVELFGIFAERGFTDLGSVFQVDVYVGATPSQYGAFDIKRYRSEGDKFYYTEKVWEETDGKPVRKEIEREISREEYKFAVRKTPPVVTIRKNRDSYTGSFGGREVHLSVDTVKFDHSPDERHFLEAEIIVENKEEVPAVKQLLTLFVADLLGVKDTEVVEAPGMFAMAFKKLWSGSKPRNPSRGFSY